MLYTLNPRTFVPAAVGPNHAALSMPLVINVLASVNVAACPFIHAFPTLLVVFVFAFVAIAPLKRVLGAPPLAAAMLHAVQELARIGLSIAPSVLTLARWLTVCVFSSIGVTGARIFI